ncbi:hypothetical protein [Streptomyces chryseus]|uniref:hypothetical protein n=1 Tax=Streptomyces chryseus TaxID=68186 RepID=UPI00110FDB7B|nr:hypothetical protein [Streptomyces chryseus]
MSANVGVALMLVSRPSTFTDSGTSARVRDAVHAAVLVPGATAAPAPSHDTGEASEARVPAAAARLSALLRRSPRSPLSRAETGLLSEWLDRLSTTRTG